MSHRAFDIYTDGSLYIGRVFIIAQEWRKYEWSSSEANVLG